MMEKGFMMEQGTGNHGGRQTLAMLKAEKVEDGETGRSNDGEKQAVGGPE